MPYYVQIVVLLGMLDGFQKWAPAAYNVEVEPGSDAYEHSQVHRAIEKKLPGRTFIINSMIAWHRGPDVPVVELEMEVA
jgi:hypothetical protein